MKYVGNSKGMVSRMARSVKKNEDKTVQSLKSPASPKEGQIWRNPKDGREYSYSAALKKWIRSEGAKGADGNDGENGVAGVDGQDGLPGQDGINGQDGLPGESGVDGQDGVNGTDATPFSHTLQFSTPAPRALSYTVGTVYYNGNTVSISSFGTVQSMSLNTIYFLYCDGSNSLKATTVASDAVGVNKVLLCVSKMGANISSKPEFTVFGNFGVKVFIAAEDIIANSLSAISANLGNIIGGTFQTAGAIERVTIQDDDIKWEKKIDNVWKDCGSLIGDRITYTQYHSLGGMSGLIGNGISHVGDVAFYSKQFSCEKLYAQTQISTSLLTAGAVYAKNSSYLNPMSRLYKVVPGSGVTISYDDTKNEATVNSTSTGSTWVGTAESDLNMNSKNIDNIGRFRLPVGTNLY